MLNLFGDGPVAQLARASALQAEGQEFESPQVHQKIIKHSAYLPAGTQWLVYKLLTASYELETWSI